MTTLNYFIHSFDGTTLIEVDEPEAPLLDYYVFGCNAAGRLTKIELHTQRLTWEHKPEWDILGTVFRLGDVLEERLLALMPEQRRRLTLLTNMEAGLPQRELGIARFWKDAFDVAA
jgi:hypothetical protein